MPTVKLSAGTIEYTDTGGSGQVIVPLHGLMMDGEVWRHIVDDLRADFRCVVPTLPLGAHRFPMRADADLSLPGFGTLISEFLDRLDLADVTVVGNDWGGAVLMAGEPRVRRLVLTPCEAFDNWPPGVPGRLAAVAARMPGGLLLAARGLRMPALRRLPMTFGWMAKRPVAAELFDRWTAPVISDARIRRDVRRYCASANRQQMIDATARLVWFDRPALVVWASEDRVMPREHGRRLAELLPSGTLVEVADSYVLMPLDRPAELAKLIREFVRAPASSDTTRPTG